MNSSIEWSSQNNIEKFEHFILLKWGLSDVNHLFQIAGPMALSEWTLHKTDKNLFPLTDSPILFGSNSIFIALSPRLLLEIFREPALNSDGWTVQNGIDSNKLNEFRILTIGNTFREIIFSEKELLEDWQKTKEFRHRVETIKRMKSYNVIVGKDSGKEFWKLNAFGFQENISKRKKRFRRKPKK